jgi:hypothetical protein
MKVEAASEIDSAWEDHFPRYRVYFWNNPVAHPIMWTSYVYELSEAHNVHQVLAWAEANARGRTYQVFAVAQDRDGPIGLLTLTGSNPTDPSDERRDPPPEMSSDVEASGAEHMATENQRGYERIWEWLNRDEADRKGGAST